MFKTKDGYEMTVGMWVSDDTGVYKIIDINESYLTVMLEEVELYEDGSVVYTGNYRRLTRAEAKKLCYA